MAKIRKHSVEPFAGMSKKELVAKLLKSTAEARAQGRETTSTNSAIVRGLETSKPPVLRNRLPTSTAEAISQLEQQRSRIDEVLSPIQKSFQDLLIRIEGISGDLEQKRRIADLIQSTASQLRLAFKCPKCGEAARVIFSPAGNATTGVFAFAHTGKNHSGTTSLPKLILMPAPEDMRRRKVPQKKA
jgi:hypothetical protein